MNKLLATMLVCVLTGQAAAAVVAPVPQAVAPAQRVNFAYHSGLLMNLHHFLFDMAVNKKALATIAWQRAPTAAQSQVLEGAIGFYRAHYAALNLRTDPALVGIKRALSVDDGRRDPTGLALPPALAAVLAAAAPVYAGTLWPLHDRRNQAWIAQVRQLDRAFGAEIQAGIETHLAGRFPAAPVRVDVVFDTGTRQGAYTDEQVVIPSGRADYQELGSLEMLYHEACHTTVTTPLEEAINARLRAAGRSDGEDLWHVVQFYTVGAVTREVLARHGKPGYQPYADKRGLYSGFWAPYSGVVETVWRAHMLGNSDLQSAVRDMVERLPRQ